MTPEPIPVPTIGAPQQFNLATTAPPQGRGRTKAPEARKRSTSAGPRPRAKSRPALEEEVEEVPVATKPRGRSVARVADKEVPRVIPPRSRSRPKPRAKWSAAQEAEEVPVATKPRGRSVSRVVDQEDPKLVPVRSKSREAIQPLPPPDVVVPQVKPRGRSATKKTPPVPEDTPVEHKRGQKRPREPPKHKETPFPKKPRVQTLTQTVRFDPEAEDMIPVPRAPRPSRSGKISKIAQALAPDVLTVPTVGPGKMLKGGRIPAAGPQGNRQPKVTKVQIQGVNKSYGMLKQNVKAQMKAAKVATALESYARFKKSREPKSLEVIRDLRGSMVTA